MGIGEGEMAGVGNSNRFKVAVFGDAMNDVYHIGTAERLSAEVPIPIVKIAETFNQPGGAANVAMNLEKLGVSTVLCYHNPVINKHRLMVGDHQIARWDENDSCEEYHGDYPTNVDAVVVSDYGKGAIAEGVIEKIKQIKAPIFVDTKRDPSVWSGVAAAIFPNAKEYNEYAGAYTDFKGRVVMKKGSYGLESWDGIVEHSIVSPSQARFVRSVNGAGDSVIAAFVYRYLYEKNIDNFRDEEQDRGIDWENVLRFANAAAAIAVEHPYTYAPTLKEVEERYYAAN